MNGRNLSTILPTVSAFHAKSIVHSRPNVMVNKGNNLFFNSSLKSEKFNKFSFHRKARSITYLSSQNTPNDEGSSSKVTPTWTYVPYKPPPPSKRKRSFSSQQQNFFVPKEVNIPLDQVEITFVRSSGAGGQNGKVK